MTADQFFEAAKLELNPLAIGQDTSDEVLSSLRNLIRKDGTPVPVSIRRTKLDSGLVLAVLRDATDLVTQRDSLTQAQEVAHVGSWEQDPSTGLLTCWAEFYNIFGMPPSNAPITLDIFSRYRHPDEEPGGFTRAAKEAIDDRKPLDIEVQMQLPSGEARTIHILGHAALNPDGRISHIYGTIQDVTPLRQAERELRERDEQLTLLFDEAADGFLQVTADLKIVECNEAATGILGRSREDILSIGYPGLFAEDEFVSKPLERATHDADKMVEVERNVLRGDGSVRQVDI